MCYANSSLQVLYHCLPFREKILNMKIPPGGENSMLFEIQELFKSIHGQKKPKGVFNHKKFIAAVKKANQLFDNDEHHDSHEFVTWLLDDIHEELQKNEQPSFVMDLFGGKL